MGGAGFFSVRSAGSAMNASGGFFKSGSTVVPFCVAGGDEGGPCGVRGTISCIVGGAGTTVEVMNEAALSGGGAIAAGAVPDSVGDPD